MNDAGGRPARRAGRTRASSSTAATTSSPTRARARTAGGWPGSAWDHPDMPWDGTDALGRRPRRAEAADRSRSSSPAVGARAVLQPEWSPDGTLLLRLRPQRLVEPLPLARRPRRAGLARPRPSSAARCGSSAPAGTSCSTPAKRRHRHPRRYRSRLARIDLAQRRRRRRSTCRTSSSPASAAADGRALVQALAADTPAAADPARPRHRPSHARRQRRRARAADPA